MFDQSSKREEKMVPKIFEEVMSKYFPNFYEGQIYIFKISAIPNLDKYEENHALAHHSQIMKTKG